MAASEALSSAREPRSVTRAAAISAMMSSTVCGGRLDAAGADDVADGADADDEVFDLLAGLGRHEVGSTGSHWPWRRTHLRGDG